MMKSKHYLVFFAILILTNITLYGVNGEQAESFSQNTRKAKRLAILLAKNHPSAAPVKIDQKINRIQAAQRIEELSKITPLKELTFRLSPEEEVNDLLNLTHAQFRLKIENDAPLYNFIENLDRSLAGLVFPKQLTIWQPSADQPLHAIYAFDWVTLK